MKKTVKVGGGLQEAAGRVIGVLERVERGEMVEPESTVMFESWSALASVMSDRRLELLQRLRRQPAKNIRQLAADIGRDYKHVYNDVHALEDAGLIDRDDEGRLCVLWDEIQTTVKLDRPAA